MGLEENFLEERNQWIALSNGNLSEWRLLLGPVLVSIFICGLERVINSEISQQKSESVNSNQKQ